MKDLISTIARALVDNPNQVSVAEIEGSYTLVLELKVSKNDIGKIMESKAATLVPSELY